MKKILAGIGIIILAFFALTGVSEINLFANIISNNSFTQKCVNALNTRDNTHISVQSYITTAKRINADKTKDLILQGTSDAQCGSAGCSYEICIYNNGEAQLIPFGYAGKELVVKNTLTENMYDLQVGSSGFVDFFWDGLRYVPVL